MDAQGANDQSQPTPTTPGTASFTSRTLLYGVLALAVGLVLYSGYSVIQDRASLRASEAQLVARHGLIDPVTKSLAGDYRDANGDLLADAPADSDQHLDPAGLVVAYYEGDDDGERVNWSAFQEQLGKLSGKEVVIQPYLNSADEIAAIRAGRIQIVALHAADVPYLVNNVGFVPIAVLGTGNAASGNHLLFATQPKSNVKSIPDLAGKTLVCTRPDSITGYRAAVAILSREANLRPSLDYRVAFSFGQKRSILGLIAGEYEVASLSADRLQAMISAGEIKPSDLRIIYESQIIPRLALGYVHNLSPALAQQIRDCTLQFENAGGEPAGDGKSMRFQPIDYRRDFAFVRQIDDSFDPRFGQIAKQQREVAEAEVIQDETPDAAANEAN